MTISELLSLISQVKGRLSGLQSLRSECSTKTSYFGDDKKVIEPTYDVKKVDQQIVDLAKWIYRAESKIKFANATTEVKDFEVDVDKLIISIE